MKFLRVLRRVRARRRRRRAPHSREYTQHKERARVLVHQRLIYWNQFYNVPYKRVAIRNQRSRWGSCSTKGNLNFNFRIVFLPPELVDYIIVHELCHLREFNHGEAFWMHVAETIPTYKLHIRALKEITKTGLRMELDNEADFSHNAEHAGKHTPH